MTRDHIWPSDTPVFELTFRLNNIAFMEGNRAIAIAETLRKIATQVENGKDEGYVFDVNGNNVGHFTYDLEPEDDEEDGE